VPAFTVLIPAFNEAATIRDLVVRALKITPQVLVVDDGSTDGTREQLNGLAVDVLRNETNQGKAAALWRGAQAAIEAGAQYVVTLDGDGQHAPEDIPRLMAAAETHPGRIVIGSRFADATGVPRARYNANRVAAFWLSWACGQNLADSQSGFRVYPAELFRKLNIPHGRARGFVFESEILIEAARHGHRCVLVPIAAIYRPGARHSHFRPVLDIVRITRMVAWKLVSRGFAPVNFYRAFIRRVR
jgi:glycosyltransferase involved in cell wall biosynthesis